MFSGGKRGQHNPPNPSSTTCPVPLQAQPAQSIIVNVLLNPSLSPPPLAFALPFVPISDVFIHLIKALLSSAVQQSPIEKIPERANEHSHLAARVAVRVEAPQDTVNRKRPFEESTERPESIRWDRGRRGGSQHPELHLVSVNSAPKIRREVA